MINFHKAWLPQLLRYAELVSDENTLRRAWRDGNSSETSVTSYQELFEQLFEDMRADEVRSKLDYYLGDDLDLRLATDQFISALSHVESWTKHRSNSRESIFESDAWSVARERATELLRVANSSGISSADFDPT
jgi:hypothetical protein